MVVTYSGSISTYEFSAAHLADCNIPNNVSDINLISPEFLRASNTGLDIMSLCHVMSLAAR